MNYNALELMLKQKRFDLVYKYLYVKYPENEFIKKAYLESIRAFNNYYEELPSDGVHKYSPEDFTDSFDRLIKSIKEDGYDFNNRIPVGNNGDITDGAHRLAICACLNKEVEVENREKTELFDYRMFAKKTMDADVMDFGALEYVKLNPNAYIVNLHSVTDKEKDDKVEEILNKYGFIYYKKSIKMTYNGYVNLKKLSYGSFWDRESWIGDTKNKFKGAQTHARNSMGKSPLRVFVFVCDDLNKVIEAKKEIRDVYNIGNYSVHINDTREEAIWLAETYFNNNSLGMINSRPFEYETPIFDKMIEQLKLAASENKVMTDEICCVGSTPLNVYGLRDSNDFDFVYSGDDFDIETDVLSNNNDKVGFYPVSKEELIYNPKYYFYYHGLKFVTLDVLYQMKTKRNAKPRDINDCKLIRSFKKHSNVKYSKPFKFYEKKKNGLRREVTILGFIKFHYTKKDGLG